MQWSRARKVYILSLEMDWVAEFGVGAYWRHNEDWRGPEWFKHAFEVP